jgi:hypothetical protein
MQSVPITTNVVSLNPAQAIQHYVIKFVAGQWFYPCTPVSSTNKTETPPDRFYSELIGETPSHGVDVWKP